jgi:putative transposase
MFACVVRAVQLLTVLGGAHRSLALENLALRQQLAMYRRARPTPAARWADRMFWVGLRRLWPDWKSALVVVRPATVIDWHRRGFAWFWTRRSRFLGGRPRIDAELRRLVREMADANRLWGAPRIHGELLKLGFNVSERTVSRLMPRRRRPPSQTWRTFLQNHVGAIVAIDFFTVPTITCRLLFVFVVLAHDRRRILHINATANPTSTWTRQQLREAFPWEATARFLLHDRDTIFDVAFRRRGPEVIQTFVSWNPIGRWLRQIDDFRAVAQPALLRPVGTPRLR